MNVLVDPQLSKAIRTGKRGDRDIHAAFTLRVDPKSKGYSPEMTDKIVKEVVSRASSETAKEAKNLVVFKNLQSFSIRAPVSLVEKLTNDDAIGTAALGS
jgi:hypothetical protein